MILIIRIKRIYEIPSEKDGYRVLIDRLWPRGMKKEAIEIDEWAKELAPANALRKWYGHDPDLWTLFRERYTAELEENPAVMDFCRRHRDKKLITFLCAGKVISISHATVLKEFIDRLFKNMDA